MGSKTLYMQAEQYGGKAEGIKYSWSAAETTYIFGRVSESISLFVCIICSASVHKIVTPSSNGNIIFLSALLAVIKNLLDTSSCVDQVRSVGVFCVR